MKENPEKDNSARGRLRRPRRNQVTLAALILAVIQACLTIEGMGIEGFALWVIILFAGYWLLFTVILWLLGKLRGGV